MISKLAAFDKSHLTMNNITKILIYILSVLILIFIGIELNKAKLISPYEAISPNKFSNTLNSKKENAEANLDILLKGDIKNINNKNDDIYYYLCINDSLTYWNTTKIGFDISRKYHCVDFIENSWCYVIERQVENKTAYAFIEIKTEYPYENDFLKNHFANGFTIPNDVSIEFNSGIKGIGIYQPDTQEYLFSLVPQKPYYYDKSTANHSLVVTFWGIVLLLLTPIIILKYFKNNRKGFLFATIGFIIILLVRCLMGLHQVPDIFYDYKLFSPSLYSYSSFFNNYGDLLINIILWGNILYLIRKAPFKKTFGLYILWLIISFITITTNAFLLFSLIESVKTEINYSNIFDFNYAGYFTAAFSVVLTGLNIYVLKKLAECTVKLKRPIIHFVIFSGTAILLLAFIHKIETPIILYSAFFFLLYSYIFFTKLRKPNFSFFNNIIIITLSSLFIGLILNNLKERKQISEKKQLAYELAYERDPIAEMLLPKLETSIFEDNHLKKIASKLETQRLIEDYLNKTFIKGYLNKYKLELTICNRADSILVKPDNNIEPCYPFFYEIINTEGKEIGNSGFYFLENLSGQISYLGLFDFPVDYSDDNVRLFIQLNSKRLSEELGYPELLIGDLPYPNKKLKKYSYAKYKSGYLVTTSGDFSYKTQINTNKYPKGYSNSTENLYKHYIYRYNENNLIFLSRPTKSIPEKLISFSYLFLTFFILFLVLQIIDKYFIKKDFGTNLSLKARIQTAILTIMLSSLIFMGIMTVYYNKEQYKQKQNSTITEKMQSVLIEMEHKLGNENVLDAGFNPYIEGLLIKFSNVFYSDINLFDITGNLKASSRPEIFEKGLLGKQMHPVAYNEIHRNNKTGFIHNETIGKMDYASIYAPFYNNNGKLLGYLNLPYFTRHDILKKETATLIAAIINIYVILFIASLIIAIFISNRITKPLSLVESKFKKIKLSGKNEQITYDKKDEIGKLIKEYNRMVAELDKSAELLALSERESAWREMAKQIAHEIKNPLTPMKLSIQHLQRAWNNNDTNKEELLNKVSNNLIEHISGLTEIANEFSNFAKMPQAKKSPINILTPIKNAIDLFSQNSDCVIDLQTKEQDLQIHADKEQILRVFNNLIKNAIQAVGNKEGGKINILIARKGDDAFISIRDNGTGIDESIKDKIFAPNFTTKSAGMGIGLSMTKSIIKGHDGNIMFDTEKGKGTVFYITIPLYQNDKSK